MEGRLARLLIARALIRGRSGDPDVWDDLRAVFKLERSVQSRPELISQLIALNIARAVNAVAWKMPLPAPAWLAELLATDYRRLLLRGMQHDAWLIWRHGPDEPESPFGPLARPYLRVSVGNLALHQRATALELAPSDSLPVRWEGLLPETNESDPAVEHPGTHRDTKHRHRVGARNAL